MAKVNVCFIFCPSLLITERMEIGSVVLGSKKVFDFSVSLAPFTTDRYRIQREHVSE